MILPVVIPGCQTARGEDISGLDGYALLTSRWCIVLAIAVVAVLGFYAWIKFG